MKDALMPNDKFLLQAKNIYVLLYTMVRYIKLLKLQEKLLPLAINL